jgi:hypothetical protein
MPSMQASERSKRGAPVAAPDLTLGASPERRTMVRELQAELEKGLRKRLHAGETGADERRR